MAQDTDPDLDEPVTAITSGALAADDASRIVASTPDAATDASPGDEDDELPSLAVHMRPALAAALSTTAAAMVLGGIFGSWQARIIGVFAAFGGAAWALYSVRSERPTLTQGLFPLVLLGVSAIVLLPSAGGPAELPTFVGDAINAGRLIRPPVPFDPGWRVLMICVLGTLSFGASIVGLVYHRPKLGIVVPLPLVGLASITQPDSEQFIAGIGALLPVLAAIGVLYGGDSTQTAELDRGFEMKRLARGAAAGLPIIALLVVFNNASFLFPEPVFDPDDKPQKPRAAPLAAAEDRVLFEVSGGTGFTGPWRIGALDVYEDDSWLIPGFNRDRLVDIDDSGQISSIRAGTTLETVTITVRDLGDSAVLPVLAGTTEVTSTQEIVLDPRSQTLRVPTGRVPVGTVYTMQVPSYASEEQLEAVGDPGIDDELADQAAAPDVPDEIQALLDATPSNPWKRMDALRQELLNVVTAKGAGAPVAVSPDRVSDLFFGSQTGTPFEIVAAEALIARWSGVPSRIGFGFDGLNAEGDLLTVRPKNAAQWLEVNFEGYGWVPLIGAPKKAEATLDSDPNARFNPTIEPSDDVAVEVYLPFELEDLSQLYQRLRDLVVQIAPILFLLGVAWIGWPVIAKAQRRAYRRRWASSRGPRVQVAVEYAEFRDLAIDLGVGDKYDTPLEYLFKVRDDREHTELAWLMSRVVYGDMMTTVSADDVLAAEELSTSLRRRLSTGQPLQMRFLAAVSRASLGEPYTSEIPNIFQLKIPGLSRVVKLVERLPRPRRRKGVVRARLAGDPR